MSNTTGHKFVEFLNSCGSPYHAVQAVIKQILEPTQVFEEVDFCKQGHGLNGYTRRNGALIAWRAPKRLEPKTRALSIVILASHTDSPCLRLRPHSKLEGENCDMIGIETYGGGLWRTWFDRGLSLAGKVIVQKEESLETHLVRLPTAVAYIPSLCIHLMTADERSAFKFNNEEQLRPIIGIRQEDNQNEEKSKQEQAAKKEENTVKKGCGQEPLHFAPRLLSAVADKLNVDEKSIVSWDLCLYDANPAGFNGIDAEFIDGPGLDNRSSLFCNFTSLVEAGTPPDETIYVAIGFDHEEVGSQTTVGADSCLLSNWLMDILEAYGVECPASVVRRSAQQSILLSCDAAHAVHPNYVSKHQAAHKPVIGGGVAIKYNANQRYATTSFGGAFVRSTAREIPFQEFEVRNDSGCGSTIGPMASSLTGIETVDVGIPIWAMHAIREVGTARDLESLISLGTLTYKNWKPERYTQ